MTEMVRHGDHLGMRLLGYIIFLYQTITDDLRFDYGTLVIGYRSTIALLILWLARSVPLLRRAVHQNRGLGRPCGRQFGSTLVWDIWRIGAAPL